MSWYKASNNNAASPMSYEVVKRDDGKIDLYFRMKRPSAEFELVTLSPLPSLTFRIGTYSEPNDVRQVFNKLYKNKQLTTPRAKREHENQQIAQEQPEEAEQEAPRVENKPEQLKFNFSSRRSKLLHKKARENKIKGGLGDNLEPEDVDKEELISGILVELEHVGNGKKFSKKTIRKFVENELIGNNERVKDQDILEKSQDIVMDHLIEISDYYTRLAKMESDAKGSKSEKTTNDEDNSK